MQVYKYTKSSFPAGSLREALWCIDFCFCLEFKSRKDFRLGIWPGNGWGYMTHYESSVFN